MLFMLICAISVDVGERILSHKNQWAAIHNCEKISSIRFFLYRFIRERTGLPPDYHRPTLGDYILVQIEQTHITVYI